MSLTFNLMFKLKYPGWLQVKVKKEINGTPLCLKLMLIIIFLSSSLRSNYLVNSLLQGDKLLEKLYPVHTSKLQPVSSVEFHFTLYSRNCVDVGKNSNMVKDSNSFSSIKGIMSIDEASKILNCFKNPNKEELNSVSLENP